MSIWVLFREASSPSPSYSGSRGVACAEAALTADDVHPAHGAHFCEYEGHNGADEEEDAHDNPPPEPDRSKRHWSMLDRAAASEGWRH
jgi:hypothetical protein